MTYSEPTDVGPAVGGHLRVSDAHRMAACAELERARQDGRLTPGEYTERAERAKLAKTRDDLIPLIRDLADPVALGILDTPTSLPWQQPVSLMPTPGNSIVRPGSSTDKPDIVVSFMSGTARRGHWTAAEKTIAVAVMGDTVVDLASATWPANELDIVVASVMGDIKLIVPPDVEVVARGMGITDKRKKLAPRSGRRVIVRGAAILADIKIVDPK